MSQENKEKVEIGELKKVDFDTILIKEIGQFGKFQVRNTVLILIVVVFSGWATSETLFTTSQITKRCLISECEGEVKEFLPPWILNAVPSNGKSFDNCHRFVSSNLSVITKDVCPKEMFAYGLTEPCSEFVYENTDSVVYEFNLACDEWRRALIGSLRTAGALASLPLTGFISDRWGRKTAVILASMSASLIGASRYFVNSYYVYLFLKIAESTLGSGAFSSSYIILMEMTVPKYRVIAGATINTLFSIGQMTTGLIALQIPQWRQLTLTLYLPQLITITYIWMLTESIRWYFSNGFYEKAEKALKSASRENGRVLSQNLLKTLRYRIEEEKNEKALLKETISEKSCLGISVFLDKIILTRVFVTFIWWITMTLVYYGLSINSLNMSGNKNHNFVLVTAVDIPGFWIAVILMEKIGRKPVLIGAYWLCGISQIGYIILPEGYYRVTLIIYLIGKCSISMVITSLYVYTAELYPTSHRHRLFALSSMVGRIGAIIAPLTPAFSVAVWTYFPFALFGALAFLSGLLVCITPETLGMKLPDTMKEATEIGVKLSETDV